MADNLKIKESLRSVKILLVEDDRIVSSLLRDVLGVMGFGQIVSARSAERALEELSTNYFDLIFCDWKLENMTGVEFTKTVRDLDDPLKKYTPIIMVTGMAQIEDVETARDAGITEYIIKPFRISSICEKIKAILERPRKFVVSEIFTGPDRRRRLDKSKIPQDGERRAN